MAKKEIKLDIAAKFALSKLITESHEDGHQAITLLSIGKALKSVLPVSTTHSHEDFMKYIMLGADYLASKGVNRFEKNINIGFNELFPTQQLENNIIIVGDFETYQHISSGGLKNAGKVQIEGTLAVLAWTRPLVALAFPEELKVSQIKEIGKNGNVIYNSTKEYINRPEYLEFVRKREEEKEFIKECNRTGILHMHDCYGLPLEVGCLVHSSSGLYKVTGRDSNSLLVTSLTSMFESRLNTVDIERIL